MTTIEQVEARQAAPRGNPAMPQEARAKIETFLEKRFGDLGDGVRQRAIGEFFAENLERVEELCSIAGKRKLTVDEREELEDCAGFEDWTSNRAAVQDVQKLLRADLGRAAEVKKAPKRPETIRDFEAFLREAGGFSKLEARAIASKGFHEIE